MAKNDLLPEPYRQALASRRALRGWSFGGVVCLAVCGLAVLTSAVRRAPVATDGLAEQIAVTQRRAAQSQAQATTLGEQLTQHRRAASAVDAVAEQPDWRRLLERINAELGDQAVLTQCRLGPLEAGQLTGTNSEHDPQAVWLVLAGVAADYAHVPAMVLRFEAIGLFQQVHLIETGRQSFAGESRIGFRIACRVQ